MQIRQVFAYLDKNLRPEVGGRVQFIEDPSSKKEMFKIFIFDIKFYNYKYIFSFIREEETAGKPTFECYVKSGFSGIDHKLDIPLTDEMFYDIKQGLKGIDGRFMKSLEDEINSTVLPTEETEENLGSIVELETNHVAGESE